MDIIQEIDTRLKELSGDWNSKQAERETATGEKLKLIEAQLDEIKANQKAFEEARVRAERSRLPGSEDIVGKGEPGKFSFTRAFKYALNFENARDASKAKEYGVEIEVNREMHERANKGGVFEPDHQKAINAASGSGGAFLISTEMQQTLLPELEASSIALGLGAQNWTGLVGNVSWNRDGGGIAAFHFDSENDASITESAPTFGNMEMAPHVYGALVKLTWKMLHQPTMVLEPWIRERMAKKIGLLIDKSYFNGSGADGQPRGLKLSGVIAGLDFSSPATVYTGSTQNLTHRLIRIMAYLPERNAVMPGAKLGWAASPFVFSGIAAAHDGNARPLMWPVNGPGIDQAPDRLGMLLGKKVGESSQLSVSTASPQVATDTEDLWYGDFNQSVIGNWGPLAFATTDSHSTDFAKGLVTVRAIGAYDVGVLQPSCFVRNTNFEALTLA